MEKSMQAQEPELIEADPAAIDEGTFFDKLRRVLGRIPFAADLLAMYFAMRDPRTPAWVKALIAGAIAYFILPLDLIPDLAPIVGYLDDAQVIAAAMRVVEGYVLDEHREQARAWLG